MNLIEGIMLSVLTFFLGLLIGLFYKYADIVILKQKVETIEANVSVIAIVNLAADVKVMKNSVLFTQEFQTKLLTICAEHDGMRDDIKRDGNRITALETGHSISFK